MPTVTYNRKVSIITFSLSIRILIPPKRKRGGKMAVRETFALIFLYLMFEFVEFIALKVDIARMGLDYALKVGILA